jgi:hypothetical protein
VIPATLMQANYVTAFLVKKQFQNCSWQLPTLIATSILKFKALLKKLFVFFLASAKEGSSKIY